jgi:acyl carrier protein
MSTVNERLYAAGGRLPGHRRSGGDEVTNSTYTVADLTAVTDEWQAVIGGEVEAEDNFFAIGGDSLQAIDIVDRIRRRLQVDLEYTDIFTYPTPAELAAFVSELRNGHS